MKVIFFDLDGTLVNTIPDITAAINHAFSRYGYPTCTPERVVDFVGHGLRDCLRCGLEPAVAPPEIFESIIADYSAYYEENTTVFSAPFPGIPEAVKTLRTSGHKLVIVTNKGDDFAKKIAAEMFDGLFDEVIGARDDLPLKPDPALGELLMKRFGVGAKDCAMVGDSLFDMRFARACGFYGVGVSWGFSHGVDELWDNGADAVVDRAEQLVQLLQKD